jgi:hypothetical protein
MASFLGWNFVTIDTARFLSNGLENVASTMSNIFEKLGSLERTIILFDEVEEFCETPLRTCHMHAPFLFHECAPQRVGNLHVFKASCDDAKA